MRCAGRKILDAETPMSARELARRLPLVGAGVVQQRDDRAPRVPRQMAREGAYLQLPDIVEPKLVAEAQRWRLGLTEIAEITEILSRRQR